MNLGITTIIAETHEVNIRSIKMLEKIGFKEISRIGNEEYLRISSKLIQFKLMQNLSNSLVYDPKQL